MSDFREEQSKLGSEPELQGLLFTGDAIRSLAADQLEAIGKMALSFGVEMHRLSNVERDLGNIALQSTEQDEPEPILLDFQHLRDWAAERGYSKSRISRMLGTISYTASEHGYADKDPHPDILRVGPDRDIDLCGIHARLVRTQMSTKAWRISGGGNPTKETLRVMVEYVNDRVQPENPLNYDDAREIPYPWRR